MQIQLLSAPHEGAPVSGPLRYALRCNEEADIRLQILDFENELRGEKCYYNTREVQVDIAPTLREQIRFAPTLGVTALHDLSLTRFRPIRVRVEARPAGNPEGEAAVEAFDERTFTPAVEPGTAPTLLTSMPQHRILHYGEAEEITLLAPAHQAVTLIAQRGHDAEAAHYEADYAGAVALRLNSADFAEAESLTVDAGSCGRVVYTLVPPIAGAVRLAWRSAAGSIEHYTFPIERERSMHTVRHTWLGANGYESRTTSETHYSVRSAFEQKAVMQALADLLTSPEVWWVESPERYTPIDVLTTQAVIHNHRTLCALDIDFRLAQPEAKPWN